MFYSSNRAKVIIKPKIDLSRDMDYSGSPLQIPPPPYHRKLYFISQSSTLELLKDHLVETVS